jgi:hypothetical protein
VLGQQKGKTKSPSAPKLVETVPVSSDKTACHVQIKLSEISVGPDIRDYVQIVTVNSVVFWHIKSVGWCCTNMLGLRIGRIRSPETSVPNKATLRNIPEDDKIQVNQSGSLRTRMELCMLPEPGHRRTKCKVIFGVRVGRK